MARTTRTAGLLLGFTLTAALTGCGAKTVQVSGQKTQVGASSTADPTTDGSGAADQATAGFVFPDLAPIVIPDVTSFTERSQQYAEKLGGLTAPGAGVLATGARCDSKGRVVNTPSLTEVNNGDGSGEYVDAGRTITINADGSGEYVDAGKTVTVNTDGSGEYVDGSRTVAVNADGAGEYVDTQYTITNKGDGTATVNGQDGVRLAPFPLFAKFGTFPPVKRLKPLGRSCGTLIRLDARVLFDFDQDTLRPEAGPVLDRVAAALTAVNGTLQVNGHTDAQGSDCYNLDLSQRRAETVAAALVERGLSADLVAKGFGESQPIAANALGVKDNPGGRALNRRSRS